MGDFPSAPPISIGTTSTTFELPINSVALLLRCPSTNVDIVYVNVGGTFANAGNIEINPGESISLSQELWLVLKAILGIPINANDYLKTITCYSPTAAQALRVDASSWAGV
jgi:hypothetical protein